MAKRKPDPFVGFDADDVKRISEQKPSTMNEDELRIYKKVRAVIWHAKKKGEDIDEALQAAVDRANNRDANQPTAKQSPQRKKEVRRRMVEAAKREFKPRKTKVVAKWMKIPTDKRILELMPDSRKVSVQVDGGLDIGTLVKNGDKFVVTWDENPELSWEVPLDEAWASHTYAQPLSPPADRADEINDMINAMNQERLSNIPSEDDDQ